ncbi:MAG: HTTM domain-containing protein [Bacteroidota bacterium]
MHRLRSYLTAPTSIAPLAVFRVLFGALMVASIIRFAAHGWITSLYVEPTFHFTYLGFGWVQPLGHVGMHALFAVMGLAALAVMLGLCYRVAAVVFFLTFTYVELIDVTNYLNHYYFVSIVSFLLIWVPAHRAFSLDVLRKPGLHAGRVPTWAVDIFKLQLGLVYVFAGLAKLHPDWLLEAMPLRLWLPAQEHLPLVGPLMTEPVTAYLFSWGGALYDLTIPFFLLWRRTRVLAYLAVIAFHVCTALLFPIGMFPYIMIGCTLIFFSPAFHQRLLDAMRSLGRRPTLVRDGRMWRPSRRAGSLLAGLLAVHFALQLLLPLRFALYPGPLFWTEEGYRFSWRVMLMEKAGYAAFRVQDPASGRTWEVANYEHLTPMQEKMMAQQPDLILQFAHYLEDYYRTQGLDDVVITAESYVTLNGRRSRPYIDPTVDLTEVRPSLAPKTWILPFEAEPSAQTDTKDEATSALVSLP